MVFFMWLRAREEGRYNIRANSVAPRMIDGGLFHRIEKQVQPKVIHAMRHQTLIPELAVETFVSPVLPGLAWIDQRGLDAFINDPAQ